MAESATGSRGVGGAPGRRRTGSAAVGVGRELQRVVAKQRQVQPQDDGIPQAYFCMGDGQWEGREYSSVLRGQESEMATYTMEQHHADT